MPQMAPYNWLMLFFMFNIIIIVIMSHNHFMFNKNCNKMNFYSDINSFLFKWTW